MTPWPFLSTPLAGRWRALLALIAACAIGGTIVALADASPRLGFSAARARTNVAAYHWCDRHNVVHLVYFFPIRVERCTGHGHLRGRCFRESFLRHGRVHANPRRITCVAWVRWRHRGRGSWYCTDRVTVRVTTRKPYQIITHRHKHPSCVHFSGLAARRVPVAR